MPAGRKRLRPILMTTFALVAGMMPVAIGMGAGAEFYSPMAVAIIGGVITSTFLTLLVIPTFYDSIELAARTRSRPSSTVAWNSAAPCPGSCITFGEAILTLFFVRFLYRLVTGRVIGRHAIRSDA